MKRAEQILVNLLKEQNLTIAFAESITCGLLSHKIGSISGTSDVFAGGITCYTEETKIKLLKVKRSMIDKYTAESQQVTDALAIGLSKVIHADIHAAITGLAAPGGTETKSKPVGTIFYSVYFRNKLHKQIKKFNGSPLQIKDKACKEYFRFLTRTVKK